MLRNYVMFMGASGLRPNEARQLRWKDITPHQDENGNAHAIIYVNPQTKTGAREDIPLRNAPTLLERIKLSSKRSEPDDLIFCDPDGKTKSIISERHLNPF